MLNLYFAYQMKKCNFYMRSGDGREAYTISEGVSVIDKGIICEAVRQGFVGWADNNISQ